jgi:adenylate cyclase
MGDLSVGGYDPEMFRDAIVVIGAWSTEFHDLFRVPHSRAVGFSARRAIPGAEVQAQAVNTLLSGDFLRPLSRRSHIVISLACGVLVTLFGSLMSVQMGIAASLIAMLLYGGATFWLFSARNLILPVVHPILTMFFAGAGVSSYRYAREALEKRFLKDIFSKTTDQKLVDLIIENPKLVTLGGEDREATILFSDIRSYSTLSEGMKPKDLIDLLNEYFTAWTDVIFRNRGMIDKFMGDAVMAVFGAPIANDTHAYDACRAAIEMAEELVHLCAKWQSEGRRTFRIGIGIHTGRFFFGTLGSEQHFSYTCVGDAVNIASRIEGINKEYGTTVLISEDTYARVSDQVIAESKGENMIRGRTGTVELFELVGLKDHRPTSGPAAG